MIYNFVMKLTCSGPGSGYTGKMIICFLVITLSVFTPTQINSQIVADHTVVDKYDDIPQYWIDQVKKMLVSYAGESHSEAIRNGLLLLEASNPVYSVQTSFSPPESYTTSYLRATGNTWGDLTHATGWINSYGEEDWFTSEAAIAQTKVGLAYYSATGPLISALGFGWCWDPAIDTPAEYLTYIEATKGYINYCASNGYGTKVFFTTGPVDYTNATGETGYEKFLGHEQIRDSVANDPSRILFDFADILCYDEGSETPNTTTWNGHTYPIITAANLGEGTWAHMDEVAGVRLAKAMWWMLARMAGWDGSIATGISDLGTTPETIGNLIVTRNEIKIELNYRDAPVRIVIYNLTGMIISSKLAEGNTITFDISGLKPGLYIIGEEKSSIKTRKKIIIP